MARAAEGEVALLCDAISDYLEFGRDCQQGEKGSYAAALLGRTAASSQCKQLGIISCRTDVCCTGLLEKYLSVNRSRDVGIGRRWC